MSFIIQPSTSVASPTWTSATGSGSVTEGSIYMVDTSAGAFTLTLPGAPGTNVAIQFQDAKGTWGINNLTINPNGKSIMGSSENMICANNSQGFGLVYNGTEWRIF
jgi:hypothetical protein